MAEITMVERHPGGSWWCRDAESKDVYFKPRSMTFDEAVAKWQAWKEQYLRNREIEKQNADMTKVNGLVAYFKLNEEKDHSTENWKNKTRYLDQFCQRFGGRTLTSVKPAEVAKWLDTLPNQKRKGQQLGDTTKANILKQLGSCFNWFVHQGHTTYSPIKGVSKPVANTRTEEWVIEEFQFKKLLPLVEPHYSEIIELLWLTGARPSEILGATGAEYSERDQTLVKIKHKTDKKKTKRTIVLGTRANEILWQKTKAMGKGLLFLSQKGNRITTDVLLKYMRPRFTAAIRKEKIDLYSFRHSFAVRMLLKGIPPYKVAGLLGNSLHVFERHYGHVLERIARLADQQVMDALN